MGEPFKRQNALLFKLAFYLQCAVQYIDPTEQLFSTMRALIDTHLLDIDSNVLNHLLDVPSRIMQVYFCQRPGSQAALRSDSTLN